MEVLDIGLEIPANITPTISTTTVFLTMKVFKCLWVMEDGDRYLRPANIFLTIVEFIKFVTMVEVGIGIKRTATIPLAIMDFVTVMIKVVTMVEADIGLLRSATLPLAIVDRELMLMGDVDIGPRPATLIPINQVAMGVFRKKT